MTTGTNCRSSAPACVRWRWCSAYELPGGFHLLIGRDVAGARAVAHAADRRAAVGAACRAGDGHRRRSRGAQPVPPHAGQRLGHRRGDRGRRLRPARETVRPRRRVRPARRDDQRHAGPHRPADGGRARRCRTRSRTTCARRSPARAPGWRTRRAARRDGRRTCAPRSSGRPPTSTASSRCSRPCCASPRSRPAPVGRRSPRSTWRRCSPMWPSCTARWPRRTASR